MKFKDIRTSLVCKLFHPRFEQLLRIVGDTRYPNVCYRCEPDYFVEEVEKLNHAEECRHA